MCSFLVCRLTDRMHHTMYWSITCFQCNDIASNIFIETIKHRKLSWHFFAPTFTSSYALELRMVFSQFSCGWEFRRQRLVEKEQETAHICRRMIRYDNKNIVWPLNWCAELIRTNSTTTPHTHIQFMRFCVGAFFCPSFTDWSDGYWCGVVHEFQCNWVHKHMLRLLRHSMFRKRNIFLGNKHLCVTFKYSHLLHQWMHNRLTFTLANKIDMCKHSLPSDATAG